MQAHTQGVNLSELPKNNIDSWLDPKSPYFKLEVAGAVFYYKAQYNKSEQFKICIQMKDMKEAAWKYSHGKQLPLDGTFGICNHWLLLLIGLTINDQWRGVPIVFFLFSAPTGSQAIHAGYDTEILTELLKAWVLSLRKGPGNSEFCPKVAITDMDMKERGALIAVWPDIYLLLCRFHVHHAWANKRKQLVKLGKISNQQLISRLQVMDQRYIAIIFCSITVIMD